MARPVPLKISLTNGENWVGERRFEYAPLDLLWSSLLENSQELSSSPNLLEVIKDSLSDSFEAVSDLGDFGVKLKMPDGRLLALKHLPPLGSKGALRAERSKAQRAYRWAHSLRAKGIASPRPIAYLELSKGPRKRESWWLCEYLSAPNLLQWVELGALEDRQDRWRTIEQVARTISALHREQIFHGDLHAGNLLWHEGEVYVIDLESIRRGQSIERAILRNLERLYRDFEAEPRLGLADCMRFIRTYLWGLPGRSQERQWLFRQVAERWQQKRAERAPAEAATETQL